MINVSVHDLAVLKNKTVRHVQCDEQPQNQPGAFMDVKLVFTDGTLLRITATYVTLEMFR